MDLLETVQHGRHPWEVRRAAFYRDVLRPALAGRTGVDVLDCGAGDAFFAASLRDVPAVRTISCWDANYDASTLMELAGRHPSLAFTRSRPEGTFGLATLLDVLEHVEDDQAFLDDIVQSSVAGGGLVLIGVPAWQALYTRHDAFLLHHRRYQPSEIDRLVARAGLRVRARGGVFHSLIAPRALTAAYENARAFAGRPLPPLASSTASWNHGRIVTGLTNAALRLDTAVAKGAARLRVRLPGLSYWVLAERLA